MFNPLNLVKLADTRDHNPFVEPEDTISRTYAKIQLGLIGMPVGK